MIRNPIVSAIFKPRHPSKELDRVTSPIGLGQVPASKEADSVVRSICGFCSTGCSLDLHIRDGEAVNLTPSATYPVNTGSACPKGWEALAPLDAEDRATTPLLRDESGSLQPVPWSVAIEEFVSRAKAVQAEHGPESMAFLSTGQIPTEEMALLGSLAKFGMGIRHGDGNTRQCMATSVVAYKQSFGFDAPPYTYADFDESDVIVLIGSNLAIAHPIMWERVLKNRHHPEIVVIDPRHTETAAASTQYLGLAPDSDLDLLYGLAQLLIERGAVDQNYVEENTEGFGAFKTYVKHFPLEHVVERTGLSDVQLTKLADTIAGGKRVSFWWTMGVNQSHQGVRTAQAIINLALMTGNIGRPGTGANSVTGQCNAMGSRLFSNTTGLLGGYDFADVEARNHVADTLAIGVETIPDEPSWPYDKIMSGIGTGEIKGLWVIATNTAHSWIDQMDCHGLLDELDFLVVQDMYHSTETAVLADLVLPAAGWGEKEGTFINSERRIGHIAKAKTAPGEALADFWIFKAIAEAWGCSEMFDRWRTPEDVFKILRELSSEQPCDFTGVDDYEMLDDLGGVQWPFPSGQVPSAETAERRLFTDRKFFTESGRAKFIYEAPALAPEVASDDYPFTLLTGRGSVADWHTRTRTEKSTVLASMTAKETYAELHPDDAETLGVHTHDEILVESRRGQLVARVVTTTGVQPGQIFIPMHFPELNRLTFPAFDPYSRQPAYKHCAVAVTVQK